MHRSAHPEAIDIITLLDGELKAMWGAMSPMNISLPDTLKAFVDEQVAGSGYGTSSEFVRELIRSDQDRQPLRRLKSCPGNPTFIVIYLCRGDDIRRLHKLGQCGQIHETLKGSTPHSSAITDPDPRTPHNSGPPPTFTKPQLPWLNLALGRH